MSALSPPGGSAERRGALCGKAKMTSPCFSEPRWPAERGANREEGRLEADDKSNPLTPTGTVSPPALRYGGVDRMRWETYTCNLN